MADLQLSWPIQKVQTVVFGADSVICADHRFVVGYRVLVFGFGFDFDFGASRQTINEQTFECLHVQIFKLNHRHWPPSKPKQFNPIRSK